MNTSTRIVIVNYNGCAFIGSAIESALAQTMPCEVIVVDNASTDSSCQLIRGYDVRLLVNECNLGFGNAANAGAFERSGNEYEYIAFLNPDACADPEWIERTTAWMSETKTDLASCVVLGKGKAFFAGGTWAPWLGTALTRTVYQDVDTDWLSGCALIARRDCFVRLGGFDAGYFLYFEDVDLSLRAKGDGMRLGVFREALVSHALAGRSANQLGQGRKQALGYSSKGRLLHRFLSPVQRLTAWPFQLVISPIIMRVSPHDWPAVGRAFLEGTRAHSDT